MINNNKKSFKIPQTLVCNKSHKRKKHFMILQNFTPSKHSQTMVVPGREAQDGQHIGLQVLGKQCEANILGSASSSLGQTGC